MKMMIVVFLVLSIAVGSLKLGRNKQNSCTIESYTPNTTEFSAKCGTASGTGKLSNIVQWAKPGVFKSFGKVSEWQVKADKSDFVFNSKDVKFFDHVLIVQDKCVTKWDQFISADNCKIDSFSNGLVKAICKGVPLEIDLKNYVKYENNEFVFSQTKSTPDSEIKIQQVGSSKTLLSFKKGNLPEKKIEINKIVRYNGAKLFIREY